jgi:hypothetical protein
METPPNESPNGRGASAADYITIVVLLTVAVLLSQVAFTGP